MPTCLLLAGLVQLLPVAIALVGREPLVRHDNEHLRHDQADDEDVAAHHPCGSAMSPLSNPTAPHQPGQRRRPFIPRQLFCGRGWQRSRERGKGGRRKGVVAPPEYSGLEAGP